MKRAVVLALSVFAGCYQQTTNQAVPVATVNDVCGSNDSQPSCAAAAGCEWRTLASSCSPGAHCVTGVCVTPDPCGALVDRAACEADTRCAWAGLRESSQSVDLCPVGQSCDTGGYCHTRGASGGGCTCVQPIVCPAGADCPTVQCDCSNPPPRGASIGSSSGSTCTCACPTCAAGEACAPCACDCGARAAGASCGGATTNAGSGTCTCACPICPVGTSCPRCTCGCGTGSVGVAAPATPAPPTAAVPADPCAQHGDADACAADVASACRWIDFGIVCITTPCPSGACVQLTPVPGGGACGCACASCADGQSCPPCACSCCGQPAAGPVPVPS
jgi:hypothetical protein